MHDTTRLQISLTPNRTVLAACLALTLAACASTPPPPELRSPAPQWEQTFDYPISYHRVVNDELMVVSTVRHLHGLNPTNGERLWRLRNVNTTQRDVLDVPHEPYILIQDAAGGAFDDASTQIIAVNRNDGRMHWESPPLPGRALQAVLDLESGRLFVVTVPFAHGDDRGFLSDILPGKGLMSGIEREPTLLALDLGDGSILWQQAYGEEVDLRPSVRRGVGGSGAASDVRVFDLDLFHPPFLIEDQVCLTYTGIRCYDVRSGNLNWSEDLKVLDDDLALTYPYPVIEPGQLIAGDDEQLYAFDPVSGDRFWRSNDFGRIPELLNNENILIAQIGGRYFDRDSEQWRAYGPYGVVALNKRTGRVLWEYSRVFRSISNVMVADHKVWFADHSKLYALDRLDGTVYVQKGHRLSESPTYVIRNRSDQIVLISEREAAGYDPESGEMKWYHDYPPIGPGAWNTIAAGLLSASGALLKLGSIVLDYGGSAINLPRIPISGSRSVSARGLLEDTTGSVGESFSERAARIGRVLGFANLTGDTQYFLTQVDYNDAVVLAAVDVHSGKTRRLTVLPIQSPDMVVDEVNGLVMQSEGSRLIAVPLQ